MLSIWHQSLVLLVVVDVSIGQVGWQETTGQWGCALASPLGTVPLHPNELSKAKDQGSWSSSWAKEDGHAEASPGSFSPGFYSVAAAQVLLQCLARMDCAKWEHVAYQFTENTNNNTVNVIFAITSRSSQLWSTLGWRIWGLHSLVLGMVWVALATMSVCGWVTLTYKPIAPRIHPRWGRIGPHQEHYIFPIKTPGCLWLFKISSPVLEEE